MSGTVAETHAARSVTPMQVNLASGETVSKQEQNALAKRLWTLRRSRKLSQQRMADMIGISRTQLAHAERGRFSGEKSQSMFQIRRFLESI